MRAWRALLFRFSLGSECRDGVRFSNIEYLADSGFGTAGER